MKIQQLQSMTVESKIIQHEKLKPSKSKKYNFQKVKNAVYDCN